MMFHFRALYLCVILRCFEFGLSKYFWDFFFVCVISHFCVQEDCDVNKYFYGKLSHFLNVYLA